MRLKTDALDRANAQIRDLATQYAQMSAAVSRMQARVKNRGERGVRIVNLRRSLEESRARLARQGYPNLNAVAGPHGGPLKPGDVEKLDGLEVPATSVPSSSHGEDHVNGETNLTTVIDPTKLPHVPTLCARLAAYNENNERLKQKAKHLKGRSAELQTMYRKVIALCTGVLEDKVEENLPALVQAVESENVRGAVSGGRNGVNGNVVVDATRIQDAEVGRVKEFLRKVEGAGLTPAVA